MSQNDQLIQLSEEGRFWKVDFEDLSHPEQVFRCVWELEGDVNNGGFDQYFFNSSGDTAFAVVEALQSIGAHKTAKIVAAANAVFPRSAPPRERNERQALLEALRPDQSAALQVGPGVLPVSRRPHDAALRLRQAERWRNPRSGRDLMKLTAGTRSRSRHPR